MWKFRKLIVQSVINSLIVDRKINFTEMQIFRCTLRCVEIFAFFSPLEKKNRENSLQLISRNLNWKIVKENCQYFLTE